MTLRENIVQLQDGFKVGYISAGPKHGKPLVFLHGWSVSAKAYSEMIEELGELGYRVYAFDAPDHGNSDSLPWGHSLKDMARIIHEATLSLGIHEHVLVGHSMGGGIAAQYAAYYGREVVKALILINAAVGQEHHDAIRVACTPTAILRAAELITGALRDIVGDARAAAKPRSVTELLSLSSTLAQSLSGGRMLRAGVALLKHQSRDALRWIKAYGIPTAIMHGSDDHIIDSRAAYSAAVACGAKLHILSGRNHSWMISNPAFAAQQIREWVRGLSLEETA